MDSKLSQIRGEIISEIIGFVNCKGILDKETGHYLLPTYNEEYNTSINHNISINHNTEDVFALKVVKVPAKAVGVPSHNGVSVTRLAIESGDDTYYADELYADDLEAILEHIKKMEESDFISCREWYDKFQNGEY